MPDPDVVLILVTLAMAVAAAARPMRLPAPSLLVVAGILVALIPGIDLPRPGPGLVTGVVLPPLLYAAGGEVLWHELRQAWFPVTVLSLGLVLASAFAIGAVVVAVTPVPWTEAVLLGSVLASTDPVAVNALGRGLALPPRLRTVLQAESLFNDATSLVLFRVSLGIVVAGGSVAWGHAVGQFVLLAGGGALVGGAAGLLAVPLRRRITDPILAATAALALPYVVYVLAQQARVSGVAAVVVTGVMLGAQPRPSPASAAEHQVTAVYGTVVFVLESVVFGLIGLELPQLVRALPGSRVDWFAPALAVAATLLVVRLLWVFPLAAVRGRRDGRSARSALPTAAVASWAGARGIVPLAAALSIPLVDDHGVPVGNRALMLALTVGVIAITLIVQGLTLEPLVKRSGVGVAATEASLYVDPIDESDG